MGADGLSAYQVAVNNGFVGTEAQWLASLVGAQGIQGIQGVPGNNGAQGIQGIQGNDGAQGIQGIPGDVSAAYPIGAVYMSVVSTNPATLFGFGTWAAIAGRFLVGHDAGQVEFDTVEETGGAKTAQASAQTFAGSPSSVIVNHTHPININDPGHTHLTQRYPTATGSSTGFTIDTSMSGTLADNTLPTKSGTTGITSTSSNPAGGAANYTPAGTNTPGAATSILPPYFVLYMWRRVS